MSDPSRLQRAVALFAAWEEGGRAESPAAILAHHEDLRDLLEPMFEDDADEDEPGKDDDGSRTFGDGAYRTIRELGAGGMGIVYEAEQVELGRRVVIKLLTGSGSASARARFRREAWTAAKLRHPGIVQVLDVGETAGETFVVMEFVEGAPLDRVLARCSGRPNRDGRTFVEALLAERLRPTNARQEHDLDALADSPTWRGSWHDTVLALTARLADALDHAHQSGVVHPDVKPSNVLVRPDGGVVLIDFGLARDADLPSLTVEGQFAGTPYYVSPEQASAGGVPIDARSDLFSLGVTLFELLTARLPFEGESGHQVVQRILTEPAPDLRRFAPSAGPDLRAVAHKALQRSPEHRYQTGADFAADLRAVLEKRPVKARPVSSLQRVAAWVRREPRIAALVATVFLSITVGGVVATALYFEAEDQAEVAELRLAEVERLADVRRLQELLDEADELWPAVPANALRFTDWIDRAEELAGRRAVHERTLRRLRAESRSLTADELAALRAATGIGEELAWTDERRSRMAELVEKLAAAKPPPDEELQQRHVRRLEQAREVVAAGVTRATGLQEDLDGVEFWRFASEELQWQHDLLAQLIDTLDAALLDPETGRLADVRSRLDAATRLGGTSLEAHADRWSSARAALADRDRSPAYDGLELPELIGLVPLGPDPTTGFHEFADVRTGEVPDRDPDGTLQLDETSAMVLVLLPGDDAVRLGASPDREHAEPLRRFDPAARGNEIPIHEVALAPFLIGKHEVARHQWLTAVGERLLPAAVSDEPRLPVNQLSHDVAAEFCKRLGYALPTEAQWEYAARGGTDTCWWTGDEPETLDGLVNLADARIAEWNPNSVQHPDFDDGFATTAPIGSLPANGFGLHEVAGNVWEWCADHAPLDYLDPVRIGTAFRLNRSGPRRSLRGGGFVSDAARVRSAYRSGDYPANAAADTGLRVVLLLPDSD